MILFLCVFCTGAEAQQLHLAQTLANTTVQSQCFSRFMQSRGLVWTGGRTAEQVVVDLQATTAQAQVTFRNDGNNGVVGYRDEGTSNIFLNSYYLNGRTPACNIASTATHEWSHILGYDHPFNATSDRPFTVPYSINAAFSQCCPQ